MNTSREVNAIDARDVVKSFTRGPETVRALDGVSLSVHAGEVVVISGPSGSGKSTLFDILLGWQDADSGTARLRAEDRDGSIGVVTQTLALFDELTIAENTSLASRLGGGDREPSDLLQQLELDELADRATSELSLGQQQRVAVVRALLSDPSVVIADEPTSHQDADRSSLVMDAFREAADRGAAVLLTSHDPRLIERCDREIELVDGRIAGAESPRVTSPSERRTEPAQQAGRRPDALVAFATAAILAIAALVILGLML